MSDRSSNDAPIALIGVSAVLARRHAALALAAGWPTQTWLLDDGVHALGSALRDAAQSPATAAIWLGAVPVEALAGALDALADAARRLPVVWSCSPVLAGPHAPARAWLAAHGVTLCEDDLACADALATLIGVDPPSGTVVAVLAADADACAWLTRDLAVHGFDPVHRVTDSVLRDAFEASVDGRYDAVVAHVTAEAFHSAPTIPTADGAPWIAVVDHAGPSERTALLAAGAVTSTRVPARALRWLVDWADAQTPARADRLDASAIRQAITASLDAGNTPREAQSTAWLRALGVPKLPSTAVTYVDDVIVEAASVGYPIRIHPTLAGIAPSQLPDGVTCTNVEQLESTAVRLFSEVRGSHARPPQLVLSRPLERSASLHIRSEVDALYGPVLTVMAGAATILDVREPGVDALERALRAAGLEPDALSVAALRGACAAAIAACALDARVHALEWTMQIGTAAYGATEIHVELA